MILDQSRFTTDGNHFDSIDGQAWKNRVFQEQLDMLEVELVETGVLRTEDATHTRIVFKFVPLIQSQPCNSSTELK